MITTVNPQTIKVMAYKELMDENLRKQIDCEKALILARLKQKTIWQLLLSWLPFQITWKRK